MAQPLSITGVTPITPDSDSLRVTGVKPVEVPKATPSLWDSINTGLLSPEAILKAMAWSPGTLGTPSVEVPDNVSVSQSLVKAARQLNEAHPIIGGLKAGTASALGDTAKLVSGASSPLQLGLLATGMAGKIPGLLGSLFKIVGMSGLGALVPKGLYDMATAPDIKTPEGAQQFLSGTATAIGAGAGAAHPLVAGSRAGSFISPSEAQTLKSLEITPTPGEQAGPGFLQAAENVAARTALTSKSVADMLQKRQENIRQANSFLQARVGGPAPATLPAQVQDLAARTSQASDIAQAAANESRARSLTGQSALTPAEAGEAVREAALQWQQGLKGQASQLFNDVEQGANERGIVVPREGAQRVALAQQLLDESRAANEAGKSPISSDVQSSLSRIIGAPEIPPELESFAKTQYGVPYDKLTELQRAVIDKIAGQLGIEAKPPAATPFSALKDARTALLDEVRQMRSSGVSNTTTGALEKLAESITGDMTDALGSHPDLLAKWEQARSLTNQYKTPFRENSLLGSLLREKGVAQGEDVMQRLLQRGNESDITDVLNVIKGKPDVIAKVQRAAIDMLHRAPDASGALRLLNDRPGLRELLGPRYNVLEQSLRTQELRDLSPQELTFNRYLASVTGAAKPEQLFGQALDSPTINTRLDRLTASNPAMRSHVGAEMMQEIFNRATKNGAFGAPDAYFDPVAFHREFNAVRPQMARFIEPQMMTELDRFSDAMRKLTLSHTLPLSTTGGLGSTYLIQRTLQTLPLAAGSALAYLLGSHPIESIGLGAALGIGVPTLLSYAASHPAWGRLLANASRMRLAPPSLPAGAAAAAGQAQQAQQP